MATTPTANPVPSNAPQDLLFNAEVLDSVVNGSATSYTTRQGTTRQTVAGALQAVNVAADSALPVMTTRVSDVASASGAAQDQITAIVTAANLQAAENIRTLRAYNVRGNWSGATAYAVMDVVAQGGVQYLCAIAHTSGTFSTDLAAGRWVVLQGATTSDLASTASGKGASTVGVQGGTTVQAALDQQISLITAISAVVPARKAEIVAHRGFAAQAPQNTLLAMSMALRRGADSLETDVQVSSDGVLYLYHDTDLSTLTSGSGAVSSRNAAYLNGLTFTALAGTAFASLKLPTFDAFLEFAASKAVRVYPEIKGYRTSADISLYVAAVVNAGMEELCTACSFTYSDLTAVRALNSKIALGRLGSSTVQATYESAINGMQTQGNGMIIWELSALVSTPAIIAYAKSKGVGVAAYTVETLEDARSALKVGVSRLICDTSLEMN